MFNEEINYKVERMMTKQGNQALILYIDPNTSEDIKPHINILKKYGAKWDPRNKRWYWYISSDKDMRVRQMDKYVNPCLRELNAVAQKGENSVDDDTLINQITELIKEFDKIINSRIETTTDFTPGDANAVKQKLIEFKESLLKCTTDEEFRKKFEPVLKRVLTGGRKYSIMNALLIMIQDPEARYVYSKGRWNKLNRYVDTAHAKPICMWVPVQNNAEKNQVIRDYVRSMGKSNWRELTPEEQDEMWQIVSMNVHTQAMKLSPSFYDIRFTKVKPFKKDLAIVKDEGEKLVNTKSGNENGDLQWFDDNSPETEQSIKIYNAIIRTIEALGIKVAYVNDLDGARGVSRGGYIDVLENAPKNIGTCNTLIHELSHEIFHHTVLSSKDNTWKIFYKGRPEGKHVVEQQAELCAWIVMRFLGYDMRTNINYLGNWGLNEDNAVRIFDQVAYAADKITSLLYKELNRKEEPAPSGEPAGSYKMVAESIVNEAITGLQVASMLGDEYRNLYLKSKQKEQQALEESKNIYKDAFKKICKIDI